MSQPKEIFVKTDRCVGCRSCITACAVEHSASKSLFGAIAETPRPKSRVYVEWVAPDRKVPLVCRHCEDAPCMHACISGAIHRDADGVVRTDTDKCIGCWTCVMVCPYGVIGRHLEDAQGLSLRPLPGPGYSRLRQCLPHRRAGLSNRSRLFRGRSPTRLPGAAQGGRGLM
jgi:Fe-S-cluster-containing hydrogenase component 2